MSIARMRSGEHIRERFGEAMAITLKAIKQLAEELRDLPENQSDERELNTQDAVALMRPEIEQLKEKGYSLEQIAELLSNGGLPISTSTLKKYLSTSSSGTRKGNKAGTRKGTSKRVSRSTKKEQPGNTSLNRGNEHLANGTQPPVSRNGRTANSPLSSAGQESKREPDPLSPGSFIPKNDSDEI